MERTAQFGQRRRYRYRLGRTWASGDRVVFVMLNPSRADHRRDDPTIRRCIGFARTWGFGGVDVVNLFAFRTHDPRELRQADDPVGPKNDVHIDAVVASASRVIAAWGIHGAWRGRDREVLGRLQDPWCLGRTKDGHPRHPLYVAGVTPPERYTPRSPE